MPRVRLVWRARRRRSRRPVLLFGEHAADVKAAAVAPEAPPASRDHLWWRQRPSHCEVLSTPPPASRRRCLVPRRGHRYPRSCDRLRRPYTPPFFHCLPTLVALRTRRGGGSRATWPTTAVMSLSTAWQPASPVRWGETTRPRAERWRPAVARGVGAIPRTLIGRRGYRSRRRRSARKERWR